MNLNLQGMDGLGIAGSHPSNSLRENWIKEQLQSRIAEYSEERILHIQCATWNVNAKRPSEDLGSWLQHPKHNEPDVYVIGFQEIVDLNAGNLLVDHNAAKPWEAVIERTLMQKYQLVASKIQVGLCLCVYVKRNQANHISNVLDDKVGVGIMGVGGNKGGVAIRLNIFDTSFCFVNSHLAAHQGNTSGRNRDYHNICNRQNFRKDKNNEHNKEDEHGMTLKEHDNIFWLGDLNYRLNIGDYDYIFDRIEKAEYDVLLESDQLLAEKEAGNAFKEWQEGKITFAPTYKYQPGSPLYERRPDKKKRTPAWCDRIQWIGQDIVQISYNRAELCISDHKPVYALFSLPTRHVIPAKKNLLQQALADKLDAWENLITPKLLGPQKVDFGRVHFETPVSVSHTFENVGHVIAKFVVTNSKGGTLPSWLTIKPMQGLISPEQSTVLTFECCIQRDQALAVVLGDILLEASVNIVVDNGKTLTIDLFGAYMTSCFGLSLNYLVGLSVNVRSITALTKPVPVIPSTFTIPKEIWRLVDVLQLKGLHTPAIFIKNGVPQELVQVRECLDRGMKFNVDSTSTHSYAESLLRLITSLREPVYPLAIAIRFNTHDILTHFCMHSLTLLPPVHYYCFVYILSFIKAVLSCQLQINYQPNVKKTEEAETYEAYSNQIIYVFARALMQIPPEYEDEQPYLILKHFLTLPEFE